MKIKVAFIKDVLTQLDKGYISFSRMCELINEESSRKEEPIPVAYEWHNYSTGHCYVGYTAQDGQDEKDGYTKKPLYYEKNVIPSYPVNFRG
jgi:hypothetical protein